jgi:hypothetical protein
MPRQRKHPHVFLALSPSACADAIGVSYDHVILPAISSGELGPVYVRGAKRRILVSDLEAWLREIWLPAGPQAQNKRKVCPC